MRRSMISYLRQGQALGLTFVLLLLPVSCDKSQEGCDPASLPPARSAFTIQEAPTTRIAAEVSEGVGKVIASGEGSANRTIFVFEERHDSLLGQMEIALMLWRLQKNQGLRQVSLEGAFAAQGDLPVKWFHDSAGSGAATQAGQEAALRLLREGEISAAEFIALTRPSVHVRGNEIESEYSVEPSKNNSALGYLIGIAEKSLTAGDAGRINDLVQAGKTEEALDEIFEKDAWSKDRYEKLYGDNVASIEEAMCILREVETKAKELGVKIDPEQEAGFRDDLNFYQTASKRSSTIVNNTLAMMEPASAAPVALIIGAAHTSKVIELIKAAKLNYVVISPLSLVTHTKAAHLTVPMYERKMALKSVDRAGMLGSLLGGGKKLPSVLGKKWLQSKAEIYASIDHVVAAATRKEPVPSDALKAELQSFQSIRIDWSSIKVTKEDGLTRVMYKVTAQTSDTDPQQTADIWVVGLGQPPSPPTKDPPPPPSPSDDDGDIEKLILAALDEERKKPEAKRDKEERVGNRDEVVIVQLSTKTRAAFATDPTLLQRVAVAR